MTLIGAPFMAHFFDHESLWDLITLPRIILREIIRYPHILMFQLRNILSMAMQQDPKKLEVPTIYFWPIFEAYVRGYTLKVWAYMVQYLHFTKMGHFGGPFSDISNLVGYIKNYGIDPASTKYSQYYNG